MDLRRYLFEHRIKVKDFSELIGCTRIHLSGILNQKRKASIRMAKSIERFTDGEVTVNEVLPENQSVSA